MPSLSMLHEPTPTHSSKMAFGRGGAGNRTHPIPPTMLSSPFTLFGTTTSSSSSSAAAASIRSSSRSHSSSSSGTTPAFSSGRGGVGNMHAADEDRRLFSFDEELERQVKRSEACAPVYHIGRGGHGNLVVDEERWPRRRESSGSEDSSGAGDGRVRAADEKKGSQASTWIKGLTAGRRA